MPTPIEISNMALRQLGASPITAFSDASLQARTLNEIYNNIVIQILRDYPWNSETARVKLMRENDISRLSSVRFAGDGLDDMTASGTPVDGTDLVFRIQITATGTPDTFRWIASDDAAYTTGVAVTGGAQLLSDVVSVTFGATTGHTLNDEWQLNTRLPEWGHDNRYRLPNDMINVLNIEDIGVGQRRSGIETTDRTRSFRIEDGFLVTNLGEPLGIRYIRLRGVTTTVGLFTTDVPYDDDMVNALAARLQAEIAFPITRNAQIASDSWRLYQSKLTEARAANRREGSIEVVVGTDFEDARRGSGILEDLIDVGRF